MDLLHPDVINVICQLLHHRDILALGTTCKYLQVIINNHDWKNYFLNRLPKIYHIYYNDVVCNIKFITYECDIVIQCNYEHSHMQYCKYYNSTCSQLDAVLNTKYDEITIIF